LKYSDPIKIRNLLQEILGGSSAGSGGGGRGGQANRADVTEAISGVYRFEAYPDKNALLVLSKTEESFAFLDSIIESLDEPSSVGLPQIVELKHANAVALAEEINALLAPAGVAAMIERPDQGLSGAGFGDSAAGEASTEQGGQMSFPWQGGGVSSDDQSPESSLIAKIRLVPIVRQNALAILAPPAYMQAIIDTIHEFDQPTRQVMISATIAAVTLTDDLELGLRWGTGTFTAGDNSVGVSGEFTGAIDDILSGVFSGGGAVFTLGAEGNSLGAILTALNQLTNVRVLQQPRTFTADNQEAIFFNGSEVPVQTTQSQSSGVVTGGFEYRDVGVLLNVRPRITSNGDVDLTINVELSDRAGTGVNDNPIFSRRQVRSQILIHNGQTVLIGGLLKESESKTKRKIPLLGDIPLIGGLFTSVDNTTIREELIVFVTPIIVDTPTSAESFNRSYLERLQEISLPIDAQLEHIDQGNDFLNQRLRNPGSDYTPESQPIQSAFDAAQPLP
jgi:general secretion pathway protein D